jgi:FxsC-like protein
MGGGGSAENPYFFVSYTRDDADKYLVKFLADLRSEVAASAGRDEDTIAFVDVNDIGLGEKWRPKLMHALSTCECFVPILTPRFPFHEFCGKEWDGFQRRLALSPEAGAGKPSRLLPVWWRPFPKSQMVPQVISDRQYKQGIFGADYDERGLFSLVRLNRRNQYADFLLRFANMMVEAVDSAALLPLDSTFDFYSLQNAFAPAAAQLSPETASLSPADHVLLVIAAGTGADLGSLRKELSSYGPTWSKWRPFPNAPAVVVAQSALAGELLSSTPLRLDGALVEQLKESPEGDMFVVLLDPWSVGLSQYKQPLRSLDQWRFLSGAVLEVWAPDSETTEHRDELCERLRAVMPSLSATGLSTSLFEVEAEHETFAQHLVKIVTTIQGRMFDTRQNPRIVGGAVTAPPQLQGPAAQPA